MLRLFIEQKSENDKRIINGIKVRVGGNGDKINNYRVWGHAPQNKINKINKMNKIIPWCDGKKIK